MSDTTCICATVLAADPLRHFKECPRREPLPADHPGAPLDAAVARAEKAEAALRVLVTVAGAIYADSHTNANWWALKAALKDARALLEASP